MDDSDGRHLFDIPQVPTPAPPPAFHSPPYTVGHPAPFSPVTDGDSRRVLQRRGSTAAADPWGAHPEFNMNPARTTTSHLGPLLGLDHGQEVPLMEMAMVCQ